MGQEESGAQVEAALHDAHQAVSLQARNAGEATDFIAGDGENLGTAVGQALPQAGDRPLVLPTGSTNFAFVGQYVEIPEDVVFTVEFSVRGAMHAVYGLLGIDKPIPGVYHGLAHPKVAVDALRTALG